MRLLQFHKLAFVALVVACDVPCVTPPCPLEQAIALTISASGTNAPVTDAFVRDAERPENILARCSGAPARCGVFGAPGTYNLEVGAPGFRAVLRTVVVTATGNMCGCDRANEAQVEVSLAAAP